MSTTTPSTPESAVRRMPLNRSSTLPSKLVTSSRTQPTAEIGATEGVETLYVHPHGKVVKFTTTSSSRPSSSAGARSADPRGPASLPWTSPTETTLAAGPLEVYSVPGSVSFLHSGPLLHAILPRSQCWCVDGVSRFAMRVLPDTYYRIELPGETPEDLEKVEELKITLKKVLFYERTACPFARGFTVDLPEEPFVRKKRRKSHGPAKKWKLERANSWKPEDGDEPSRPEDSESEESESEDDDSDVQQDSTAEGRQSVRPAPQAKRPAAILPPSRVSVKDRIKGLTAASRSFTAPSHLPSHITPMSRLRDVALKESPDEPEIAQSVSAISLQAEERPLQAIPTAMPPSPPDSSAGFDLPDVSLADGEDDFGDSVDRSATVEQLSFEAITITHQDVFSQEPETLAVEEELPHELSDLELARLSLDDPRSAALPDQDIELETFQTQPSAEETRPQPDASNDPAREGHERDADPFAQIQARIQARRSIGGTITFHPTIQSPSRSTSSTGSTSGTSTSTTSTSASRKSRRPLPQQQALTTALVKKACTVFLGPPTHLVMIMLRIAARFANGTFGEVFSWESPARSSRIKVPGSFDLDGSDVEDLDGTDDFDEDDFGIPLRSPIRLAAQQGILSRMASEDDAAAGAARRRSGWDVD